MSWARDKTSLLEIGSRYGYTLCDLALQMKPGSKIVSVDWPDQEGWKDPEAVKHLQSNVSWLKDMGYDANLMIADSHDQEVVQWVKQFAPFDVVFIDGDHTYEGVSEDWKNYGPFGSRIIFHDIRPPQPPEWMGLGVWRLWDELRSETTEEFRAPGSKMGIGRLDQ